MPQNSAGLEWIKASRSIDRGACVELARAGDMIALRDPKNLDVAPLLFTRIEMGALLHGARHRELDHLA